MEYFNCKLLFALVIYILVLQHDFGNSEITHPLDIGTIKYPGEMDEEDEYLVNMSKGFDGFQAESARVTHYKYGTKEMAIADFNSLKPQRVRDIKPGGAYTGKIGRLGAYVISLYLNDKDDFTQINLFHFDAIFVVITKDFIYLNKLNKRRYRR